LSAAPHRALVYHDDASFLDGVVPFVREGMRDDAHVLAVVTPKKGRWLREALADEATAVEFADAHGIYERHGRMFTAVHGSLERHGVPGRGRLRLVAEQALASRTEADVRAYMRYEAAANLVFRRYDASVLCPYDVRGLPDAVVRDALCTHPEVVENGRSRHSSLFEDPRAYVRRTVRERPAPADAASARLEGLEDLPPARALVRAHAEVAGLADVAVEDMVVAASEVATNALLHGRHPRTLWTYVAEGHLVCQVRDAGPGPPDPLAGFLPPNGERLRGRGLWLAHQLCDIVEIAGGQDRTNVYLRMRLRA